MTSYVISNPKFLQPCLTNFSTKYRSITTTFASFNNQASVYEKQGRATIADLATKFRGYRREKSRTPHT